MIKLTEVEVEKIRSEYDKILKTYAWDIGDVDWRYMSGSDVERLWNEVQDTGTIICKPAMGVIKDFEDLVRRFDFMYKHHLGLKINEELKKLPEKIDVTRISHEIDKFVNSINNVHRPLAYSYEQILKLYYCKQYLSKELYDGYYVGGYDREIGKEILGGKYSGKTMIELAMDNSCTLEEYRCILKEILIDQREKENAGAKYERKKAMEKLAKEIEGKYVKTSDKSDTDINEEQKDAKGKQKKQLLLATDKMQMLCDFASIMIMYEKRVDNLRKNFHIYDTIDMRIESVLAGSYKIEDMYAVIPALYSKYKIAILALGYSNSSNKGMDPGLNFNLYEPQIVNSDRQDFFDFMDKSTAKEINQKMIEFFKFYDEKCMSMLKTRVCEQIDNIDIDSLKEEGLIKEEIVDTLCSFMKMFGSEAIVPTDKPNMIDGGMYRLTRDKQEIAELLKKDGFIMEDYIDGGEAVCTRIENIDSEYFVKRYIGTWLVAMHRIEKKYYGKQVILNGNDGVAYVSRESTADSEDQIVSEITGGTFYGKGLQELADEVDLKTFKEYAKKYAMRILEIPSNQISVRMNILYGDYEKMEADAEQRQQEASQQLIPERLLRPEDIGKVTYGDIEKCEEAYNVLKGNVLDWKKIKSDRADSE